MPHTLTHLHPTPPHPTTDRVDRLRPEDQLTLKVASVQGLTVYRQLLQAAHPQHPSAAAVEASLCALEAASFLQQDPVDPAAWRFCQVGWGRCLLHQRAHTPAAAGPQLPRLHT